MNTAPPKQKALALSLLMGKNKMLKIGDTIGIIGGGQLGRMLAMAAAKLGFKTIILDPQENSPAFACAHDHILAAYDDIAALQKLSDKCDIITYEFENVPVEALKKANLKIPIHPNAKALETSQDRLVEKNFFHDLGIKTAPFFDIKKPEELGDALTSVGQKGILKTRRMGYDGKGQVRVSVEDTASLKVAHELINSFPCILEGFVPFLREVSIIAARNTHGDIACYSPAENVHKDGILHTSTLPAKISEEEHAKANEIAHKTLNALNYVGVIGIEFFVLEDGSLLVNEFAPRVHNSGHWTEAACIVSQFEQHIRAITSLPLGNPLHHSNCIMENLIGDDIEKVPEILEQSNTMLHLYGKREARQGRKMGHFTKTTSKPAK